MRREYVVTLPAPLGFDVVHLNTSMAAARAWARLAFPGASVRALRPVRFCGWCLSAPCVGRGCRRRRVAS